MQNWENAHFSKGRSQCFHHIFKAVCDLNKMKDPCDPLCRSLVLPCPQTLENSRVELFLFWGNRCPVSVGMYVCEVSAHGHHATPSKHEDTQHFPSNRLRVTGGMVTEWSVLNRRVYGNFFASAKMSKLRLRTCSELFSPRRAVSPGRLREQASQPALS